MKSLYESSTSSLGKVILLTHPQRVESACLSLGVIVFQVFANPMVEKLKPMILTILLSATTIEFSLPP